MATPAVSVTPSGGLQGLPKASNSQPSLQENADKSEDNVKQRFCLKWNNYQSNVTSTFKDLLAVEDFVDITLSAEGGALRAHKVVLSACSPYFRDILKVSILLDTRSLNMLLLSKKHSTYFGFHSILLIFRAFLHGSTQSLC